MIRRSSRRAVKPSNVFLFPLTVSAPSLWELSRFIRPSVGNVSAASCCARCSRAVSLFPQCSSNILRGSVQFASLARHSKERITESLHPRVTPPAVPSSLPPPCCFKTSKVRLITNLRGDGWLREVCSLLWNHPHGFQRRVHTVMYFHPTHGL